VEARLGEGLRKPRKQLPIFVAEGAAGLEDFASAGASRDGDAAPNRVAEVYAIYVAPAVWGRGVGRALMGAALAALSGAHFAEATLWVLEENDRARRFYEGGGWADDGTARWDTVCGEDVSEVRYRIRLDPTR
jgi:ribosomal protein S18 acetylase RimI-like enzyme